MTKFYRDVAGPCEAPDGSVVTVGAFDGLHRGHRALLTRVRERADALGLAAVAVSFEPLPRAYFSPEPLPRLASVREKLAGLRTAGMDVVLLLRFNQALTAMPAEDFVRRVLAARLAAREVWVGGDFRFGHKRGGDFALLEQMGPELGFVARAMPVQRVAGAQASSSAVREALAASDFERAETLLGRPFAIEGRVVAGEKLGRTLGYPTANVSLGRRVVPIHGIFAVRVDLADGRENLPGVASLGVRPTVNRLAQPLLEVHLFDFDGDLYGRRIRVRFVDKLREETHFDDLDALVAQMDRDAAQARDALGLADPREAENR
jgi:riboflavin kinase/FMN adenylyltransferase